MPKSPSYPREIFKYLTFSRLYCFFTSLPSPTTFLRREHSPAQETHCYAIFFYRTKTEHSGNSGERKILQKAKPLLLLIKRFPLHAQVYISRINLFAIKIANHTLHILRLYSTPPLYCHLIVLFSVSEKNMHFTYLIKR